MLEIIVTIIVSLLLFLGNSKEYLNAFTTIFCIKTIDPALISFVAVLLQTITVTYPAYRRKKKLRNRDKQLKDLLKNSRFVLKYSIEKELELKDVNLNIRIFKPMKARSDIVHTIMTYIPFFNVVCLKNINIPGLAEKDTTEELYFEEGQGLVWKCYAEKSPVYDDDLEHTNESEYNLNSAQILKTNRLKFSICIPLFNKNERVIAVIAFDSNQQIRIKKSKQKSIVQIFTVHGNEIKKLLPDILEFEFE